jgi:hypothetical protein
MYQGKGQGLSSDAILLDDYFSGVVGQGYGVADNVAQFITVTCMEMSVRTSYVLAPG